jgi:hypothetical protein
LRRLIEERVMTPIASKIAEDPLFRDRGIRLVTSRAGEMPESNAQLTPHADNAYLVAVDES